MASDRELGLYGVAARVAEVASVVPIMLHSTLYPAVVRNYERAPELFEHYSQRVFDTFSVAGWISMIGLAGASMVLLVPIFGHAYDAALPTVLGLAAAIPLVFLQWAMSTVLTVRGWMWKTALVLALGVPVNLILNLWLIPEYGGLGAAWATIAAYATVVLMAPLLISGLRPSGRSIWCSLNPVAAASRLWVGSWPVNGVADA